MVQVLLTVLLMVVDAVEKQNFDFNGGGNGNCACHCLHRLSRNGA
jgi:hypothetical protein